MKKIFIVLFCGLLAGCNDNLCRHFTGLIENNIYNFGILIFLAISVGCLKLGFKGLFIFSSAIVTGAIILKLLALTTNCNMWLG